MRPSAGAEGPFTRDPNPDRRLPTWPRVIGLLVVIVVAFFVVRACEDDAIEVGESEAVELAKEEVDFEPTYTQVRFIRQGINRAPFWFVSLSIPIGDPDEPDAFKEFAMVQVDGRDGTAEIVEEGQDARGGRPQGQAAGRGEAATGTERRCACSSYSTSPASTPASSRR